MASAGCLRDRTKLKMTMWPRDLPAPPFGPLPKIAAFVNHCILYCIGHYIACVLTFRACARVPLDAGWSYIPSQAPSTMTGSPEPHASKQTLEFPQHRVAPGPRRRIVAEELTNGCAPDCAFLDRDPADRNWRRAECHVVRVGAALGVRSRAVVADIVGKRSPRIEDQQAAKKAARVPPDGPRVDAPGDLIFKHLRESHRALEIEGVGQITLAQLREQPAAVGIIMAPSISPGRPGPAVGAANEKRFGNVAIERIAVSRDAPDPRIGTVGVKRAIHEAQERRADDDVVLNDDRLFAAAEHLGHAFRDIAGETKVRLSMDDVDRLEAVEGAQHPADSIDARNSRFVLRCVAKDVEVRVGRVRIAPQRVEGKPEVLGPAVGEQRDRRRHAAQAFPKNARTLSITASRAPGDMPGYRGSVRISPESISVTRNGPGILAPLPIPGCACTG